MKLCRQAEEALREGLASLLDDVLSDVWIVAVEPGADPHHLVVWLGVPAGLAPERVQSRLDKVAGRLRSEVAEAITRKRAPLLTFLLAPTEVPS